MSYTDQLIKFYLRYVIILLLCLSLLVGPHIHWNTKRTFCTRKSVSAVSNRTIQVAKARQLPNLTYAGFYGSGDMYTCADACCDGVNWKLVSLFNDVCEVSPFLELCQPVKKIPVAHVSTVWMEPTT